MTAATTMIDLDAFRAAPLGRDPFDHIVVPGFIRPEAVPAIQRDYPRLDIAGSVPLGLVPQGPSFDRLMQELRGGAIERAFSDKFGLDLAEFPRMFTVRSVCRPGDGRVHVDAANKVVTVLIYMNPPWQAEGGRLRLLRSPDLADSAAEVPPLAGTLLAFRRSETSWHGHAPYEGPRRAIQMNWVRRGFYAWQEQVRHRAIAWWKLRSGTDWRFGGTGTAGDRAA